MNQMTRITAAPVEGFKARFTMEEFVQVIDSGAFDEWKIELIDGELERMPPPGTQHSSLQTQLAYKLIQLLGLDRVFAEIGVDLGGDTLVGCDVAVVREAVPEKQRLRADDLSLAAEIAEPTIDRDLGMKCLKYAAAGIPEYWVVDGNRSCVHIFRTPRDGDYADIDLIRFGQLLPVPGSDRTITLD